MRGIVEIGHMSSVAVYDVLKHAIERHRSVRIIAGGLWRDISPLALGYKGDKLKVLAYQYRGDSASGLPADGGWRCFFVDDISWAKETDDRWQTGHYAVAKVEASLDTVICGAGAQVRTYGPARAS
jgi:hypothetical protein